MVASDTTTRSIASGTSSSEAVLLCVVVSCRVRSRTIARLTTGRTTLISRTRGLPVKRLRSETSARMLSARKRSGTALSFGSNRATSDRVTTVSGQSLIVTPPLMSSCRPVSFSTRSSMVPVMKPPGIPIANVTPTATTRRPNTAPIIFSAFMANHTPVRVPCQGGAYRFGDAKAARVQKKPGRERRIPHFRPSGNCPL